VQAGRVFNETIPSKKPGRQDYRLSRARRSVECAFRIMCTKWLILLKYIETDEHNATSIVLEHEGPDSSYLSSETEQIRSRPAQHRFSSPAETVRERFLNYFNSVGSVPWQNDHALPGNIRHNTV
jgi:hypothetical protein